METKTMVAGLLGLGALGAGVYGLYLMGKEASSFGFIPQDLGTDKTRAQQYLAAQTKYGRHMDTPKTEVMNNALAMETGKAQELSKVIHRMRGSAVRYEKVSPWGVGRPEEY